MQSAKSRAPRRIDLVRALNRASRETGGLGALFAQGVANRLGISQGDLECIDIISLRGRMTAGELAAASGLTTGAVTGVIDRLELAGYARRERDPVDRRKVYVTIAPKALEDAMVYYGPFEKAFGKLLDRYSDREVTLLVDYFTRSQDLIRDQIERLRAAPPKPASGRQRSRTRN